MLSELNNFYETQTEPNKGVFLALRHIILNLNSSITEEWKYGSPFFYFNGKMFCYFWKDKKTTHPYIGVVQGLKIKSPFLVQGNRTRMKILPINPNKDININLVTSILNEALTYY